MSLILNHSCRTLRLRQNSLPRRGCRNQAHDTGGVGGPPRPPKPTAQDHGDDADDGQPRHHHRPLLLCLSAGAVSSMMMGVPAPALAKDDEIDKYVSKVMDTVGPLVATLGFSGFAGLCVGKALKAVSGCLAIAIGAVFISVQLVCHQTGKKLDFSNMENDWFKKEDVSSAMREGLEILSQGIPSVGAFLAGLALGIKW